MGLMMTPLLLLRRSRSSLPVNMGWISSCMAFSGLGGNGSLGPLWTKDFSAMDGGGDFPFALMWANRMPRGVLPVKHRSHNNIGPGRLVYTDPDDFLEFIKFIEERYFSRSNYFCVNDMPMLSIFDSTFFLRQLGEGLASLAIHKAKDYMRKKGYPGLHLIAINPAPAIIHEFKKAGFVQYKPLCMRFRTGKVSTSRIMVNL